jgi:Ca-activated chloride channel homolog
MKVSEGNVRRAWGALLLTGLTPLLMETAIAQPGVGPTCRDNAMLVFDASGSMAGTDFNNPPTPRIAKVKEPLRRVLPSVAAARKIRLIDYGPRP